MIVLVKLIEYNSDLYHYLTCWDLKNYNPGIVLGMNSRHSALVKAFIRQFSTQSNL